MEVTKILWSGLTGRVGQEAIKQVAKIPEVEIVAGVSRHDFRDTDVKIQHCVSDADGLAVVGETDYTGVQWLNYRAGMCGLYGLIQQVKRSEADVIVEFSHAEAFDKVLELAVRAEKPIIVGTSGLSNRQLAAIYDATNTIPVFRDGNFRFKVKKFIDEAVKLAMATSGNLTLYENFYEGKSLPSKTAKVIQRRIHEATGKTIEVYSRADLPKKQLPCQWKLDMGSELRNSLSCSTVGFDELAHDVLKIAGVMAKKPVQPGKFYDLEAIWDNLEP